MTNRHLVVRKHCNGEHDLGVVDFGGSDWVRIKNGRYLIDSMPNILDTTQPRARQHVLLWGRKNKTYLVREGVTTN